MHLIKKARAAYQKYWFLLTQLVSRDFKTKYKRSVLGVLWSMLNPLLTMGVQYIVFSELFRFLLLPSHAFFPLPRERQSPAQSVS